MALTYLFDSPADGNTTGNTTPPSNPRGFTRGQLGQVTGSITLDAVYGTGWAVAASDFGLNTLQVVSVSPVSGINLQYVPTNASTGTIKAYGGGTATALGPEVTTTALMSGLKTYFIATGIKN